MSYDTRCYELAEAFLSDEPEINNHANRDALATLIQDAIESYIQYDAHKVRNMLCETDAKAVRRMSEELNRAR